MYSACVLSLVVMFPIQIRSALQANIMGALAMLNSSVDQENYEDAAREIVDFEVQLAEVSADSINSRYYFLY